MKTVRVLHIITRLIVGGAQENTVLTVSRLNSYRWHVDLLSGPETGVEGSLIDFARTQGVFPEIEPCLVREIHPLKDLVALIRMFIFIRRGRYTIVHTHSSKAGILGRIAARCAGVPVILHTVHGWSFHDHMSRWLRRFYVTMEKMAARLSNALVAVSRPDISKGTNAGIGGSGSYTVIRSGIELDRFGHPQVPPTQLRSQLGIPGDALVVGSVMRFSPPKAPLDLVDAFAQISRLKPSPWFLIVGDGELRGIFEARARELGIASQTVLTGLRHDIPELMAAMDIFVFSSLWEGLPRVLPQAMATGLPIVCTRTGGSVEVVENDRNGFLVEPGTSGAIAAKVQILLEDSELRRRMGAESTRRVSEFSCDKMVNDIDLLYQQLLAQRS